MPSFLYSLPKNIVSTGNADEASIQDGHKYSCGLNMIEGK